MSFHHVPRDPSLPTALVGFPALEARARSPFEASLAHSVPADGGVP